MAISRQRRLVKLPSLSNKLLGCDILAAMTTSPLAPTPSPVPPPPEAGSWFFEYIWNMPAGIGALIGALIGFGALIYVTRKGYQNLAYAQAHQAKLDRDLADDALRRERTTIYTAIAADLDALQRSLTGFREALMDPNQSDERNAGKSVFRAMRHVVWENSAPKLGLLDPTHAANIVETYRYIDALSGRVDVLDLENENHRNDLAGLTEDAVKNIKAVRAGLPIHPNKVSADPK